MIAHIFSKLDIELTLMSVQIYENGFGYFEVRRIRQQSGTFYLLIEVNF